MKKNLLFTLGVLAAAGLLFVLSRLTLVSTGGGPAAVLTYGDPQTTLTFDLSKDGVYDVDTGEYTIHLRVEDGTIAFVDSPCPDHLCEGFGRLKAQGDWAACMPARASLTIQ